jgi:uncharacterized protein DUF5947
VSSGAIASSRLRELAQRSREPAAAPVAVEAVCDLCAAPLAPGHRHVLDLDSGEPQCACRACAVLFDREQAGGGHYRLIPERRVRLDDFSLEGRLFAALGIPVDLAFLYFDSRSNRMVSRYPGALGLITGAPAPDAWQQVVDTNPALRDLQPDVEALLVNRSRGASEQWILPIDDCFRLAARVRSHWTGFGGGDRVWEEIAAFFEELRSEREEAMWP